MSSLRQMSGHGISITPSPYECHSCHDCRNSLLHATPSFESIGGLMLNEPGRPGISARIFSAPNSPAHNTGVVQTTFPQKAACNLDSRGWHWHRDLDATLQILDALGAPFEWEFCKAGMAGVNTVVILYRLPLDSIRRTGLALKGPSRRRLAAAARSRRMSGCAKISFVANVRPAIGLVPGGGYGH